MKARWPDTYVEVVALGPLVAIPALEDLLRLGADKATLLSDPAFAGSDSLVRTRILAEYLRGVSFDCILAGAQTADGADAEVPPHLADLLALPQVSNIIRVDEASLVEGWPLVDVDEGRLQATYRIPLPAVLSLKHHHAQVLPHVSLRDSRADVGDRLHAIDNDQLGLPAHEVGTQGSLTQVVEVLDPPVRQREPRFVRCNAEGIEQVHAFLQSRGLITHTTAFSPSHVQGEQVVLVGRRPKDPPGDIRDAEILISGGGGVAGSFDELQKLAAVMGGRVTASRRAVDLGVAARAIQVGQSGRTVSPRLYIALGIDGAGQHIEGLRNIESIISVNTNRHAPICSISDIVVEGDAREFIERLCRRINEGTTAALEPH